MSGEISFQSSVAGPEMQRATVGNSAHEPREANDRTLVEEANRTDRKEVGVASAQGESLDKQARDELEAESITPKQLEEAVQRLSDYVSSHQRDLQFTVDDDTGRTVIKVIDRETDEVVRQIPSEDMLNLARSLNKIEGVLFRDQA